MKSNHKINYLEIHNQALYLAKINKILVSFLRIKNLFQDYLTSKNQINKNNYLEIKNKNHNLEIKKRNHYLDNQQKFQTNSQAQYFNHKLVRQKYFNLKINHLKEQGYLLSPLKIHLHLKIKLLLEDLWVVNLVKLQIHLDKFNNKYLKI